MSDPATRASETPVEMLSRVRQMAEDDGETWDDLSDNDQAALRYVLTLLAQRDALQQEVTLLREARNDSCACEHDGRGSLTTECQEHQAIREQRDALAAALREACQGLEDVAAQASLCVQHIGAKSEAQRDWLRREVQREAHGAVVKAQAALALVDAPEGT